MECNGNFFEKGTLRNRIKQAEIDQGEREGLTTEEREELRALRREVKVLKQERDFLKKPQPSSQDEQVAQSLFEAARTNKASISKISPVLGTA